MLAAAPIQAAPPMQAAPERSMIQELNGGDLYTERTLNFSQL